MGVKRGNFFIHMNDKINTNIMDSLKYNTNLNIGIEMYKKIILIIMEKYRTQRRIIFLPFLLHVQPSTKVCLSRDRICGGSHECIIAGLESKGSICIFADLEILSPGESTHFILSVVLTWNLLTQ